MTETAPPEADPTTLEPEPEPEPDPEEPSEDGAETEDTQHGQGNQAPAE